MHLQRYPETLNTVMPIRAQGRNAPLLKQYDVSVIGIEMLMRIIMEDSSVYDDLTSGQKEELIQFITTRLSTIMLLRTSGYYKSLPCALQTNQDIVNVFLDRNGLNFMHCHTIIQHNIDIVLDCLGKCPASLAYVPSAIMEQLEKDHAEVLIGCIDKDGQSIGYCSESIRSNVDLMLMAINTYPPAINDGTESVFHDSRIIEKVIDKISSNTFFCLRNDNMLDNGKYTLEFTDGLGVSGPLMNRHLLDNVDIATCLLSKNGTYYNSLPESMRSNKDLALLAIKTGHKDAWVPIEWSIPDMFKNDADVMMAIGLDGFSQMGSTLKQNKDFILEYIAKWGDFPEIHCDNQAQSGWQGRNYVAETYRYKIDDTDIARALLKHDGRRIDMLPVNLITKPLVLWAIEHEFAAYKSFKYESFQENRPLISLIDEQFIIDTDIIKASMMSNPETTQYIDDQDLTHELLHWAIECHGQVIDQFFLDGSGSASHLTDAMINTALEHDTTFRMLDMRDNATVLEMIECRQADPYYHLEPLTREQITKTVMTNPFSLRSSLARFLNSRDIVDSIIANDINPYDSAIQYLDQDIFHDTAMAISAVSKNPLAYQYLPRDKKTDTKIIKKCSIDNIYIFHTMLSSLPDDCDMYLIALMLDHLDHAKIPFTTINDYVVNNMSSCRPWIRESCHATIPRCMEIFQNEIIKLHDEIFGADGETSWYEKYTKVVWFPDTISTSLRGSSFRQNPVDVV